MRILVLTNLYPPDFVGGYELGCAQVVDALRHHGHEVRVLTSVPRRPMPTPAHVQRTLRLSDIFHAYYLERSIPAVRHLVQAEANFVNAHNIRVLTGEITAFQPDVAYIWNIWGLGGLGLMHCLEHLQVRWVWHLMDCLPAILCSNWNGVEKALARAFGSHLRGFFIACSRRLLREIEDAGIQLEGQVEVLPNWVCGRRPAEGTHWYRGRTLRMVYAGQIGKHKGIDLIIRMARLLCDSGRQNFSIDLYGKTTDPSFADLIRELEVEHVVALRGVRTQAELADLYPQYDLFVFPTWQREPFAFAPLEAALHRCVPLQSRSCGNSEWLVHGVHCLKAERTAEAFAAVVADVLDGRIELAPLGRRVAAVVYRDFHLEKLLPRVERTLERAAATARGRAGTPEEVFRLAALGERLTGLLVQECLTN
jgi:glycogen(starch) synthase